MQPAVRDHESALPHVPNHNPGDKTVSEATQSYVYTRPWGDDTNPEPAQSCVPQSTTIGPTGDNSNLEATQFCVQLDQEGSEAALPCVPSFLGLFNSSEAALSCVQANLNSNSEAALSCVQTSLMGPNDSSEAALSCVQICKLGVVQPNMQQLESK